MVTIWITFSNENLKEWFLLSARMTRKFMMISFAEYQKVLHAQPLVISITWAYVSGLCKRGPFCDRKARSVTELARQQKQNEKKIIIVRLKEGKKGNSQGTRQEPLRIQVNNNCSKYSRTSIIRTFRLSGLFLWSRFFFKQKTAYEILSGLVGSEMCIRDSTTSSRY